MRVTHDRRSHRHFDCESWIAVGVMLLMLVASAITTIASLAPPPAS